ncbi:hypothetical protein Ancab_020499 [Ancistrocladus abbreviatus]
MAEDQGTTDTECLDLISLLSSEERDFLVRNNGDRVKIKDLSGKTVGLYFSGSWCPPCRGFTPILIEVYQELSSSKGDFEVVFISSDRDEESFNGYLSKMPWLAIPFSDKATIKHLGAKFEVMGIPHLVFIDGSGKVTTDEGDELIREYRTKAYPFTQERIDQLKEEEMEARRNQTLKSILVSDTRDYVISKDGNKIRVPELQGKMVGLYFCISSYGPCIEFTEKLMQIYRTLKEKGENFEIVSIPLDDSDDEFKEGFATMPWFALPFGDMTCDKLVKYFELNNIPRLVIIGPDGKTLNSDVAVLIDEHGVEAYPFTPEKLDELAAIEKARLEAQTLGSLLVSGEKDFVIDKSGSKVPVSNLVGKHILLYFSAHWCPPCRSFTPELIKAYHEIKEKEDAFEVIFISSDSDQSSFDEYYSSMPWLALPFGDERKASLSRRFKVAGIPCVIAINPAGKTVTTEARRLIGTYGAEAFPFTEDHIKHMKQQLEDEAKGWPEKLKHELHEHELLRVRRPGYICNACQKPGAEWSFYCDECDFDLHPKCALKKNEAANHDDGQVKEGYICDGDVCRKI